MAVDGDLWFHEVNGRVARATARADRAHEKIAEVVERADLLESRINELEESYRTEFTIVDNFDRSRPVVSGIVDDKPVCGVPDDEPVMLVTPLAALYLSRNRDGTENPEWVTMPHALRTEGGPDAHFSGFPVKVMRNWNDYTAANFTDPEMLKPDVGRDVHTVAATQNMTITFACGHRDAVLIGDRIPDRCLVCFPGPVQP